MPIDIVIGPDDPEFDVYKTREAEVKAGIAGSSGGGSGGGAGSKVVVPAGFVVDSDDDDSSFCFPIRRSTKGTSGSTPASSGKSSRRASKGSVGSSAAGRRRFSAKSIGSLLDLAAAAAATATGSKTAEAGAGGSEPKVRKLSLGAGEPSETKGRKLSIGAVSVGSCRTPKSQCSTPGAASTKSSTPKKKFFSFISGALPLPTPGVSSASASADASTTTSGAPLSSSSGTAGACKSSETKSDPREEPLTLIPSGSASGRTNPESPKSSKLMSRLSFSGSHILTPDRRKFIAQERLAWEGTPEDDM